MAQQHVCFCLENIEHEVYMASEKPCLAIPRQGLDEGKRDEAFQPSG